MNGQDARFGVELPMPGLAGGRDQAMATAAAGAPGVSFRSVETHLQVAEGDI